MGILYSIVYVLIASLFSENCIKRTFLGCPRKFYHRVMYIAPSSGHELLKLNLPFKIYSNDFCGCFLMSGVRMLQFLKFWWKFIQIHEYYTVALIRSCLLKMIGGVAVCGEFWRFVKLIAQTATWKESNHQQCDTFINLSFPSGSVLKLFHKFLLYFPGRPGNIMNRKLDDSCQLANVIICSSAMERVSY